LSVFKKVIAIIIIRCDYVLSQGIVLTSLKSASDVVYGPKDVYLFLHVRPHGPLLYHIYVWVGIQVHGSTLEEAFKHAQNLVHSLPGKAVLHKEVNMLIFCMNH
jgi:hypothetical protein